MHKNTLQHFQRGKCPLPLTHACGRPCMYVTEPSIRRVWPTVVPAQCRMTSLLCRKGCHLDP